jgi:hypothetical protein
MMQIDKAPRVHDEKTTSVGSSPQPDRRDSLRKPLLVNSLEVDARVAERQTRRT